MRRKSCCMVCFLVVDAHSIFLDICLVDLLRMLYSSRCLQRGMAFCAGGQDNRIGQAVCEGWQYQMERDCGSKIFKLLFLSSWLTASSGLSHSASLVHPDSVVVHDSSGSVAAGRLVLEVGWSSH